MAVRRSLLNPQAPEYTPISHTNSTVFHPLSLPAIPYHFSTPPRVLHPTPPSELSSPPPFPTVDSPPRAKVRRSPVTRAPRNIPPRFVEARENSRRQLLPRLRNAGYVPRQRGRGFSTGNRGGLSSGSCSNEGLVWRRVENDQRCGVCYGNLLENHNLKKHDVIRLSWSQKNTTTVMIKNIPYDYNREMLMQFLDDHCLLENQKARNSNGENVVLAYDFLYLPMDFKNKRSRGYAFVNFTDHRTVWNFFCAFNDKLNVFRGSARGVKIVTAKIQGKEALVNRFKETKFECESEGLLPVWFSPPRDGSGELVQMITVGKCKATHIFFDK